MQHRPLGAAERAFAPAWPHENGGEVQFARLAIDAGYEAPAVYAWARGNPLVSCVKGVESYNRSSPVSGPTYVGAAIGERKLKRGAKLWTVAVSTFKSELCRFLRLSPPTDEEITAGGGYTGGHPGG